LVFALVFFYPVLCDSQYFGPGIGGWLTSWPDLRHFSAIPVDLDRDLFMHLRWVPYYTLTHFHQLPFWNPYKCGGMPMIGNPESSIVTPFLLPYLVFGLVPGVLMEIYLHLALLFAGGYALGKEFGFVPTASIVLAAVFPSSSWLSLHIAAGHLNFLSIAYIPWILALLLVSCRTQRWYPAMLGGLLCGLTLTEGNYGFVFAAMLVAILAVAHCLGHLSVRPLAAGMVIGIFALAFSALKLVPTAELLNIHPRDWGLSFHTWWGILVSLFSRDQDIGRPAIASFFFSEYGGYLGPPFCMLALVGIFGAWRKSVPWLAGAFLFLMMYRGDTGPNALTMWLRLLPLAGNIGLCGRWVIPLVFCVGVLAALGTQFLCERWGNWGARIATVLLVVGLIDAWLVCAPNYRYLLVTSEFPPPPPSPTFRQYWGQQGRGMIVASKANMGALNCFGCGYTFPRGNVLGYNEPGYRGEFYLLGAGDIQQLEWTPNRLKYEVNVPTASSVVVNQNMYPGWTLARGTGAVYAYHELLSVSVPAGHQEIELIYRPRHIIWAFLTSALAIVVLIATWLSENRIKESATSRT
jgi:hypothetical protein